MLIVGLTGGIGSGKSTVAQLLAGHGAQVIDVDAVGRAVIAPGGRAEAGVVAEFGEHIVGADGAIDRRALAGVVFEQPGGGGGLARLEAISHPAINAELTEIVGSLDDGSIVVYDMAVLVESNLGRSDPAHRYSHVVVVEAPLELRIERAVARGMGEADARARAAAQVSDEQRRAVADLVVPNDADLDALQANVLAAWATITSWAGLLGPDQRRARPLTR
ncbi:MAG: dephospho-CoA kinase [Ilumatobacteraceae bacterium]